MTRFFDGARQRLQRLWDGGTDWALCAGVARISVGAWQLSAAAGLIVRGLFCVATAVVLAHRTPRHR